MGIIMKFNQDETSVLVPISVNIIKFWKLVAQMDHKFVDSVEKAETLSLMIREGEDIEETSLVILNHAIQKHLENAYKGKEAWTEDEVIVLELLKKKLKGYNRIKE